MLSKTLIVFSFFSFFVCSVYAQRQTVTVEGIVLEKSTKTPLPGATLLIEETRKGYVSDESGRFKFSIEKGNYTLLTSFVGYQSARTKLSASNNQKLEIVLADNTALEEDRPG